MPTRPTRWRCWKEARRAARYLLKDRLHSRAQLLATIETVAQGGSVIDPKVVEALVHGRSRQVRSPLDVLTPREREILVEMARGASNAAIAETPGPDQARRREAHQLGVRQARPAALRRRQPSRARGPAVPRRHGPRSSYGRHDLEQAGWIGTMRPRGTRVQSSPGSDVALRSAAFARPRPRPAGPRPAVVQTALAGSGARRGGRRRRRAQPLPPTSGRRGGAVRSADRRDDGGRVRRAAPGHRAPAVAGPAHAGALLGDGPGHPGGARPRCPRADRMGGGARGRRLHPAVLPGGPAPRSGGTRGRRRDRAGSGPRLGRPARHRRAPARVHAVGELPRRMPAQPGQDPGRRRNAWATRWRWPRGR